LDSRPRYWPDSAITDYILEQPAKCPNCRRNILEKTLIEPAKMRFFVIRMSTGEYLTKVRIISNYLEYEFTADREQASKLNDFDSQLVLKN
jgi:hypothetical protein